MRILLFFSGILLFFGTVNAQINVPQVQKSFYGVYESTGCGYCGQYAVPLTEEIVNQYGEKAIFFSLHHSGSLLYSSTGQSIANSIGGTATPYWSINATPLGFYTAGLKEVIVDSINANYSATETDVNAGFSWSIENDTIYVETVTEFFNSTTGDYNVAVYLSEDSIYAYQSNYDSGIPSGAIYHNHILRTGFSSNSFGEQVASGVISAGSTYTKSHKIAVDPLWDLDQVHLSAFIWKDNGGSYAFKNANDIGEEIRLTSVDKTDKQDAKLTIYPNPVSDNLTVVSTNLTDNSFIRMSDINGRVVYENKLNSKDENLLNIDVNRFVSGTYILSIISNKVNISKQVIVK